MRHPEKDELEAALSRYPSIARPSFPGRLNDLDTGVLVPILGGRELRALLTERPKTMRNHGGEVSFPGGKPEPGDADLLATALREAHEETGLRTVEVLGKLSSVPLKTSAHRIHPFVGWADERELAPNPDEVARLVVYSLPELYSRPAIDAIPWSDEAGEDLVPVFETGGRMLFGATAYVLYELLLALAPAFDTVVPPRVAGRYTWDDALRQHD